MASADRLKRSHVRLLFAVRFLVQWSCLAVNYINPRICPCQADSVKGSPLRQLNRSSSSREIVTMQVTKVSLLIVKSEDVQAADVSHVEGSDRLGHRAANTLRSGGM
jgi:hypothetical protein